MKQVRNKDAQFSMAANTDPELKIQPTIHGNTACGGVSNKRRGIGKAQRTPKNVANLLPHTPPVYKLFLMVMQYTGMPVRGRLRQRQADGKPKDDVLVVITDRV